MSKQLFIVALVLGSVASIGNLPAQDNQNRNTAQPTLEDRTDQLERGQQDLKAQIQQLRNDVSDLQDRANRSEGGPGPAQGAAPRAAKSPENRNRPGEEQNAGSAQTQSFDVFYQGLQSGGHWFDDPTYGHVWQPDVAVSDENWRPYSDGHWAYTDRGWTWISNEDFGWATYHYGRWARRTDSGWIWIPGGQWAPAWVSWRQGNDHVGWAPLPPEVEDNSQIHVEGWADNYYDIGPAAYVFVSIADLARPTYRDVIAPSGQNIAFITETKNVTDIAYQKNGVTVKGPTYQQLASQAHIPQYTLHYATQAQGRFGISTRGNELQVMAPPATLQRNATTRPKVEKQLAQANLDHGWQQIDQAKATELKQTMEKQAPVPANLPKPATPTQNQPAQPTNEQTGGKSATLAPPNQTRPAAQQGTPARATPYPAEGAPPRPEAAPPRPGTEQYPPAPTPEQSRQMRAPTPGAASRHGEESQQRAAPSPSPKDSVEQREQRQEAATPPASPSVEPRNQSAEKSPSKEQSKKENQGSSQPPKQESSEAPKRIEPGSQPSGNDREKTPRQRRENRGEEPSTKTEQPPQPKPQTEGGRAAEKNQLEGSNAERNKDQMRQGAPEEKPRKEESPVKPRGNQREKQDTE